MKKEIYVLKLKEVIARTRLSKSNIHRLIANGLFPKPFKLGARGSGWVESEILDWLQVRIELSRMDA